MTRSTVMKRTCPKSLQPSKVSRGCHNHHLPHPRPPRTAGWPSACTPHGARLHPPFIQNTSFTVRLWDKVPSQGTRVLPLPLRHSRPSPALPAGPSLSCPSPPLPSGLQVGSWPLPPRSCSLPGPQHTICSL